MAFMVNAVGTQTTCRSAILFIFSSPMKKPCSIESHPASTANCTGSLPLAWTITFRPSFRAS